MYAEDDSYHFALNVLFLQHGVFDKTFSFNGPSWSLTIEAFMYVLFWMTCRSGFTSVLWAVLAISGVAIAAAGVEQPLVNLPMARGLFGFFLGCLLQLGMSSMPPRLVIACAALQFAVIAFLARYVFEAIPLYLCSSALSAFLISLISVSKFIKAGLEVRPFKFLGEISLSMYLIHVPVQIAMLLIFGLIEYQIPFSSGGFMSVYALTVLSSSTFVYWYFEMPVQNFIRIKFA